jgi:hypothetical protein
LEKAEDEEDRVERRQRCDFERVEWHAECIDRREESISQRKSRVNGMKALVPSLPVASAGTTTHP